MHREHTWIAIWRRGPEKTGVCALIDTADAERIEQRTWFRNREGYVIAFEKRTGKTLFMHREVLGLAAYTDDPREVDHINRSKLDNRRENLRIVTRAENCQNMPASGRSPFRGVYWDARNRCWRAEVKLNGKKVFRGSFGTELEAAIAAEAARKELMPFAQPDPALAAVQEGTSR